MVERARRGEESCTLHTHSGRLQDAEPPWGVRELLDPRWFSIFADPFDNGTPDATQFSSRAADPTIDVGPRIKNNHRGNLRLPLAERVEVMNLIVWLPALFLLGLAAMAAMFLFLACCEKV